MKSQDIKEGGLYTAKVNGRLTTVRVEKIKDIRHLLSDEQAELLWCALDAGYTSDIIEAIATSHPEVREKLCGTDQEDQ